MCCFLGPLHLKEWRADMRHCFPSGHRGSTISPCTDKPRWLSLSFQGSCKFQLASLQVRLPWKSETVFGPLSPYWTYLQWASLELLQVCVLPSFLLHSQPRMYLLVLALRLFWGPSYDIAPSGNPSGVCVGRIQDPLFISSCDDIFTSALWGCPYLSPLNNDDCCLVCLFNDSSTPLSGQHGAGKGFDWVLVVFNPGAC